MRKAVEMPASGLEVAVDAAAEVGEGPLWDPTAGVLYWVDITRQQVHRYDPERGSDDTFDVGQEVGALGLRASGGLVLALRDGFGVVPAFGAPVELIAPVEADVPGTRMNDGRCDAAGRFWAGTMGFDEAPGAGALYRLDPDRTVRRMLAGVTISNGVDWSPDGRTMYYVDSKTWRIDAFAFDPETGELGERRAFAAIPREEGMPDGMTVDAEGFVWVALWGGGAVRRYEPSGALERVIRLPATQVTACAFGGQGLRDLYVTSAARLSAGEWAEQPHAGALFRYRLDVAGRVPTPYRG